MFTLRAPDRIRVLFRGDTVRSVVLIAGFLLCAAGIGILGSVAAPELERTLRSYKLLPEPEPFTELFIENHTSLPAVLPAGTTATTSFTIRNREHRIMDYPWFVTRTTGTDSAVLIASGTARLRHEEQRTITFRYKVATTGAATRVQMSLPPLNQSIHFWVNQPYNL